MEIDWSNLQGLTDKSTEHMWVNFQVCLAYKSCTGEELDVRWLKSRCQNKDQYIFEEYCGIVTEYRQQVLVIYIDFDACNVNFRILFVSVVFRSCIIVLPY